jgi:hypothetical protein
MQSKPIRNSDFDAGTAKHVTFFNENFKRGRCDLLKNIQRSTRGGGATNGQDQQREVQELRDQVQNLEDKIADMNTQVEERMRRLELDMLARMEQMMLAMQQQQQTQMQLQSVQSIGTTSSGTHSTTQASNQMHPPQNQLSQSLHPPQNLFDPSSYPFGRDNSITSIGTNSNSVSFHMDQSKPMANRAPTLPPHPKMKALPVGNILPADGMGRFNSIRGISNLSRGISGLSRGASIESSASAVLMRNSWEDKFFSTLMLGENGEILAGQDMNSLGGATSMQNQLLRNQSLQLNPSQMSNNQV